VLGQTVRAEREKARLSQEALAEKAGLTRNYIGDVERAERKITLETLARVAKALKCRVRDLLRNA
jgi:transcriptional regulator with XRE-family HTH domain